ncbi:MAG TPA: BamA/TamA family outer membrane protein [Polyangiaceae bacterium]
MGKGVTRSGVLAGAALFLVAARASADPASITGRYTDYEDQAIHDAASELKTTVEPQPEGKRIERIVFVRLDPIDTHDPLPLQLDVVHATSRPHVLAHEILVRQDDVWKKTLVDESARNLRLLPQLSLVLIVPMRGSTSGSVVMVVITKDVWSLYVDFDIDATSGGIEMLDLEPKETNIAGLQHTALARFVLTPNTYSFGASYEVPRLDGRWLDLLFDGNVIVNSATGAPEGTYGSASITRPLYSSQTKWAWTTFVSWTDQIDRRYENARLTYFDGTSVPWLWRERTLVEQAKITRSFGWETKNDLSVGASIQHTAYEVPSDPSLDPAAVAAFQRADVPVGEDRVGPFIQWHGYTSNFVRVFDLDTLGLQEDNRLGHDLWLRLYPVFRAVGSTRDLFGAYAAAACTVALGDGLMTAAVETTTEVEPDRISDASVQTSVAIVTPRTGVGRLVFATTLLDRWRNYLNVQSYLGGDTMLRGFPSHQFAGKNLFATNLEYRTPHVDLASILLGLAAFYDVGDAFDGFDHFDAKHSVGFGMRAVFPQVERAVMRFDVGFPIETQGFGGASFQLAFHQAIGVPVVGGGRGP